MLTTFKVLLMIMAVIGFIGAIGEKDNEKLRETMLIICSVTVIGVVTLFVLL